MTPIMLAEAREIPDRTAAALAAQAPLLDDIADRLRRADPTVLVTVARGSSDHAAEYAGRLFAQTLGWLPASLPPSLVTVEDAPLRWRGAVVLAISQSGRSPDLIAPIEAARAGGALTIALTNVEDSPLAAAAECAVPIAAGPETAVAATKSFVLSLIQIAHLAARTSRDRGLIDALAALPPRLDQALSADWSPALEALADIRSGFVVGRGLGYAVARELALKFKEVCGLHAEAASGAEIMHGPKALIGPTDPVLCLTPDDPGGTAVRRQAASLAGLSSRVIAAGLPVDGAAGTLPVPAAPHPVLAAPILATAAYPFIAELAQARGLSPDTPRHLKKVTETL